jgi:hypothetical protein
MIGIVAEVLWAFGITATLLAALVSYDYWVEPYLEKRRKRSSVAVFQLRTRRIPARAKETKWIRPVQHKTSA